ncbi:lymphocyte-specific protein 1 isoform X4 [Muntiacus reevesi]|uniref:lymphocyte-specific protein 1 isoform X4 n=1 Tax=Muntiacus reevesi TaxID=9886 RepID=UPI003307BFB5
MCWQACRDHRAGPPWPGDGALKERAVGSGGGHSRKALRPRFGRPGTLLLGSGGAGRAGWPVAAVHAGCQQLESCRARAGVARPRGRARASLCSLGEGPGKAGGQQACGRKLPGARHHMASVSRGQRGLEASVSQRLLLWGGRQEWSPPAQDGLLRGWAASGLTPTEASSAQQSRDSGRRRDSSSPHLCRRLAAQWSVEDEEEAARERRRRDRERHLRAQDEDEGSPSPEQSEQEKLLSPQPSEAPELDEDEGFGDWSQKPEQQRQQHWGAGETTDAGGPPGGDSPEGTQEDDRPHQRTSGSQGADELSPAEVRLEELHLSPDLEPREGLAAEAPEPSGPEEPVQGSPGLAGTEEAEAQLSDRTESLNRSIKKSNSVKRSQPALPISKIDERLEQYTHAVETAGRTPKLTRQPSIELPSMAVASTKSRWETGEVQAQSAAKSAPCKDIVAGDMSRRDLWEQKGGPKTSSTVKQSTPSGKRYKFVATGHGKYEKVLVDEGPAP